MDSDHHRTLVAAQGYCELGMHDDALAELDLLPPEAVDDAMAVEMRLVILMQARRWRLAFAASRDLCRLRPDVSSGFIQGAFCLHEMGDTAGAREFLRDGPAAMAEDATYHYNLACYECVLGQVKEARGHLARALAMDNSYAEFARKDPDLAGLHEVQP